MATLTIGSTYELMIRTDDIGRTLAVLQGLDAGVQMKREGDRLHATFSRPVSCNLLRAAGFQFTGDDPGGSAISAAPESRDSA